VCQSIEHTPRARSNAMQTGSHWRRCTWRADRFSNAGGDLCVAQLCS
jgi:hypothetical protein